MARTNSGSTANFLSGTETLTNEPLSLSAWMLTNDLTTSQVPVGMGDGGAGSGTFFVRFNGSVANDPVQTVKVNDAGSQIGSADINTTISTGTWFSVGSTFTSDTDRSSFFNGSTASNTTSVADPTVNFISVLAIRRSITTSPVNGNVAEVGVWNTTLTQFEHESMQHGCTPMLIRPTSLVRYYPLFGGYSTGGENDWISPALNLTETGTIGNAAHPSQLAYPVP